MFFKGQATKDKVDLVVYLAIAMTGHNKKEMYDQSVDAMKTLEPYGITCLSPVLIENVKPENEKLVPISEDELKVQWYNDKNLIRQSHVLLDLTGLSTSEGVKHEIGYARFGLFMPIVRIYPGLGISVARLEDDAIVTSVDEAAKLMVERWGTRKKRIAWRWKKSMLSKWFRLARYQLKGLFR